MLVIPKPKPRPEAVPEPTGWESVADLRAQADAHYENSWSGIARLENIAGWQELLDYFTEIEKMPWPLRFWNKLAGRSMQTDHRVGAIIFAAVMGIGLYAEITRQISRDFLIVHLAVAFCFVALVLCIWHAHSRFRECRAYQSKQVEQRKLDFAKPSANAILWLYMREMLEVGKIGCLTPLSERLPKLADIIADVTAKHGPGQVTDALKAAHAAWLAEVTRDANEVDVVITRIINERETVRHDVELAAPRDDDSMIDEAQLAALLPQINAVRQMVLKAKDALRKPTVAEILASASWKELVAAASPEVLPSDQLTDECLYCERCRNERFAYLIADCSVCGSKNADCTLEWSVRQANVCRTCAATGGHCVHCGKQLRMP